MPVFALTIFVSAFLLFQVQPLMGKFILPWFGGSPAVWTACMLFFQVALLVGYAYAHHAREGLPLRKQAAVHAVLLLCALLFLPITPAESSKPLTSGNPTISILWLLARSIGGPFVVIASTAPLLQHWYVELYPKSSPYRLYALSNFGSLLALLSFPFVFEPRFTRAHQSAFWSWGFVLFVICCGICAAKIFRATSKQPGKAPTLVKEEPREAEADETYFLQRLLWFLLPACASTLLLAITNKLCQDIAVVPFLWVLPLALYLLSFIICFDNPRWYARLPFAFGLIAALAAMCWASFHTADLAVSKQIVMYGSALFVCCMVCHGELYRLRPSPRDLTAFYLVIAIGGAFGGLFVGLAAPLFMKDYFELHWGIFTCAFLFFLVCLTGRTKGSEVRTVEGGVADRSGPFSWDNWRNLACGLTVASFVGLDLFLRHTGQQLKLLPKGWIMGCRLGLWAVLGLLIISWASRGLFRTFRFWRVFSCLWLLAGLGALSVALVSQAQERGKNIVQKSRSFYGVLTVLQYNEGDPVNDYFLLRNGRITHGLQFANEPISEWPTTYYGEHSGASAGLMNCRSIGRKVGVVGLGVGTLAAYGEFGDWIRFYEINPEVIRLAATRFSYLTRTPADVTIAFGDARLSMERESPQDYDLLVLDAFSSDSIPVHLLTTEAFGLYERHLGRHGIIAVHISNNYLDLEPVVARLAREHNFRSLVIDATEKKDDWWLYSSLWMLLARDQECLDGIDQQYHSREAVAASNRFPLWTDDFTSLYQILK